MSFGVQWHSLLVHMSQVLECPLCALCVISDYSWALTAVVLECPLCVLCVFSDYSEALITVGMSMRRINFQADQAVRTSHAWSRLAVVWGQRPQSGNLLEQCSSTYLSVYPLGVSFVALIGWSEAGSQMCWFWGLLGGAGQCQLLPFSS